MLGSIRKEVEGGRNWQEGHKGGKWSEGSDKLSIVQKCCLGGGDGGSGEGVQRGTKVDGRIGRALLCHIPRPHTSPTMCDIQ